MKHIVIKSIIATFIIVSGVSSVILIPKKVSTMKPNIVQAVEPQSTHTTTPTTTAITPAVQETVTPVVSTPVEATIVTPVIVTKTIDDYINEYFGSTFIIDHFKLGNMNDATLLQSRLIDNIKTIINNCPDRFTSDNIDISFKYLANYFSKVQNINPDYAINYFAW